MNNILEELWYGNIAPLEQSVRENEQMKELIGYIAIHRQKLEPTLSEDQKEILEKYSDCVLELDDIREREIFSYAFRLGARMAIEIMSFNC